jgi:hypothetical protein
MTTKLQKLTALLTAKIGETGHDIEIVKVHTHDDWIEVETTDGDFLYVDEGKNGTLEWSDFGHNTPLGDTPEEALNALLTIDKISPFSKGGKLHHLTLISKVS